MGCGASKGKEEEGGNTQEAEIDFKDTGVWSMDDFFGQAKKTLDSFKDITGPLNEQKEKFFDSTGFYEVPGAEVKHAFLGMFVFLSTLVNGELESLGVQWGKSAPFVEMNTQDIGDTGLVIYEGFINYINALQACITEQIPQVIEDADRLQYEADKVKDRAADQLEQLDFMKKAKALANFAYNVKQLSKVPAFIKNGLEGLKNDLEEVKNAKEEVQANWPKFKGHGQACSAAGIKSPVPCYKQIYGPIKYTMPQRLEWESQMRDIVWRKFTKRFNPIEYPMTDLIEEAGAKK